MRTFDHEDKNTVQRLNPSIGYIVVALISFAMIKIYDWQTVNDITGRQPTICEVHGFKNAEAGSENGSWHVATASKC